MNVSAVTIPGYTFGRQQLPASPVRPQDLELLLDTVLWTEEDAEALRMAGSVLEPQVDQVLDLWYGFVGSHAHLIRSFNGSDGVPSSAYLEAVRVRFKQWILDLCTKPWDQRWLDYQHEIARRHVVTMGRTDNVHSDQTHIPLRYMIAFVWPITATIRGFLSGQNHSDEQVEAMYTAWFKAVTVTVALWAQPYQPELW